MKKAKKSLRKAFHQSSSNNREGKQPGNDVPKGDVREDSAENKAEAEELTDLDKLYIALLEVGRGNLFDLLCYSFNITSLDDLQKYTAEDSTSAYISDEIKSFLEGKDFNFKELVQKYKRSKLVQTCEIKHIPVIPKKDLVVTRTLREGPFVGQVCEAQLTLPDGRKEKVCLRYQTVQDEDQMDFLREAEIAFQLRHENILAYYGVVIASSYSPHPALVVEFAEYGNLSESLPYHNIEHLWRYTIQAATALEYLEKRNVIHLAVFSYNFLVVAGFKLKLAGLAACWFKEVNLKRQMNIAFPETLNSAAFMFGRLFSKIFSTFSQKYKGHKKLAALSKWSDVKFGDLCPSHFCDVFQRCLRNSLPPSFSEIRQSLVIQEHPLKLKVIRKFEGSKDGFLSCNPGEIITLISKKRHKYDKTAWFGVTQSAQIGFFPPEYVEEVRNDNVDGSVIPPEIQARGPRAELAFQKALRNGRVQVFRGRIMILGQDRAGKTSLKKSLLGMPFNPEEESTVGVEVDPSKCEVDVDQVTNWQRTEDTKLDVSHFVEDIARIVAKDLKETDEEPKKTNDVASLLEQGYNDELQADDPMPVDTTPLCTLNNSSSKSEEEESMTTDNISNSGVPVGKPADLNIQLSVDTSSDLQNDVTELVVQYLQALRLEDHVKTKETSFTLWDFAGQQLYYASHSVFLSPRAVYALVYNLTKDLNAPTEPRVKQGIHDIILEKQNSETNLESLLSWLASIHSIRPAADEPGNNQQDKRSYLRPPVFIVGTNADKPFEDIKKMEKCIQRNISGKVYEKHVIRPLFAVDNTRSMGDDGVQALQQRIMEVFRQEPYMGEEIPIRWFNFEKIIEALVAKGTYHMDFDQLLTVTKKVCEIDDKEEMMAMLNFYHDLGVIVKYGRTVVLQAQWLIDLFKRLITVRPFDEMDPLYSECWKELEESGILRMTLVDHVFADVIQNGLSKEDILDMMELYGLIAKFSFFPVVSKDEQKYFVPAQLRSSPAGLCEIKTSSDDPCPLYLHFLDGFVPHGLFPQLLARFIRWSSEHAPNQAPNLYHNGARLFIGRKNMYSLVLICRKRFIKIVLKQKNPALNTPFVTTAQEVRVFLEDSLQGLSLELPWLRNLRCELCVACPSCLTHGEECAKHGSVCCAHDDCLHLLRVIPEDQLFCPKSFTDEALQIDGLHNWFQNEEQMQRIMPPLNSEALQRPFPSKTGTPSTDDLLLLAFELGSSWKMLGRTLSLPEAVLEQIEEDNPKLIEKCCRVLIKWTEVFGPSATYESLAKALQHPAVGRGALAVKYCDVPGDVYTGTEASPISCKIVDDLRWSCPVFLSYQWDLQETVKGLKNRIEENGIQCWMDIGQMGGGDALFAKIDAGIRACKVFVCCVTKRYCQSDACQREATLACNLKKPIIPLLFENMSWPPEGQLALIFTTLLYIKMSVEHGKFPDTQFQEMLRKVGEFVQT